MKICNECGTQLPEDLDFCPTCGAPTELPATIEEYENQTEVPVEETYEENYTEETYVEEYTEQPYDQTGDETGYVQYEDGTVEYQDYNQEYTGEYQEGYTEEYPSDYTGEYQEGYTEEYSDEYYANENYTEEYVDEQGQPMYTEEYTEPVQDVVVPKPEKQKQRGIPIFVVIILLVITLSVSLLVGYIVFSNKNETPTPQPTPAPTEPNNNEQKENEEENEETPGEENEEEPEEETPEEPQESTKTKKAVLDGYQFSIPTNISHEVDDSKIELYGENKSWTANIKTTSSIYKLLVEQKDDLKSKFESSGYKVNKADTKEVDGYEILLFEVTDTKGNNLFLAYSYLGSARVAVCSFHSADNEYNYSGLEEAVKIIKSAKPKADATETSNSNEELA